MWKLYNQNTTVGSWTKLDSVKDLNFRLNILEAVSTNKGVAAYIRHHAIPTSPRLLESYFYWQ